MRKAGLNRPFGPWRALQISFVCLFLYVFFLPSLHGNPPERGKPGRPLIIGIDRDYPPFEYLNKAGQPEGHDVDMIREIAKVMNLEIRIVGDTWSTQIENIRSGKIDVLSGMLKSESRERFADFTRPYLTLQYSIFIRKDSPEIPDLEALRGRKIWAGEDTQGHDHLKTLGFKDELLTAPTEPDALRKLAAGHGDAALLPHLEGMVLILKGGLGNLKPTGKPVYSTQACFGVTQGDDWLRDHLNTGLAILNQTGKSDEIYERWFGHVTRQEKAMQNLMRKAGIVILILGLGVILVLIWNRTLSHQVAARTQELAETAEELAQSRSFLKTVVDHLPLMVYAKAPDDEFRYVLWNPVAEAFMGLPASQVLGKRDRDFMPPSTAQEAEASNQRIVQQRKGENHEEEIKTPQGLRQVRSHKVPVLDEKGQVRLLLCIAEDITEQRRTEAALRQTQRRESLSVLAGGVAHDFNNLLTTILGRMSLLRMGNAPAEHLDPMETAVLKAAGLAKQMLSYSGKDTAVLSVVYLNDLIQETTHLLSMSISPKIQLEARPDPTLPPIFADPSQIQQVITNLVINACEAIGEKEGRIFLEPGLETLRESDLQNRFPGQKMQPGLHLRVRLEDSGSGIPREVLEHIFDPFFTTKFSGRGLGLAAVRGILHTHGAGITVESEVGKGTRFELFFQAIREPSGGEAF